MRKILTLTFGLSVFFIFNANAIQGDDNNGEHRTEECEVEDLFYTVQLGVYSKQIPAGAFPSAAAPIYYMERSDGNYAYFSGLFDDRFAAMRQRYQIVKTGSYDVYVAAYFKREQVNMIKADELLEEYGESILYKPKTVKI